MFDYNSKEGFEYACYLLKGFLSSDFFENKDNLEEITLTEEELKKMMLTKPFKDYLVQRQRDYELVASFLAELSYSYDEGFGQLLEINPGRYEVLSALDTFFETKPTILTPYADELFYDEDLRVINGSLDFVNLHEANHSIYHPIIRVNESSKNFLSISNFDTFFYLNDIELYRFLSLLKYSIGSSKKFVGGIVTNVYDTNANEKIKQFKELVKEIEKKCEGINVEQYSRCGSIISLVHTLD